MKTHPNFRVLHVDYNEMLQAPAEQAERVREFLGLEGDVSAMAERVDLSLWRNRSSRVAACA